jgi:predicted nucleic acid-binding protein
MIVVSDTSPLHYLILIDQDDLLPQLFGRAVAPEAVIKELSHPKAPDAIRQWAANAPSWLEIRNPVAASPIPKLGEGETAAIALANELGADVVLIDERDGARIARKQGLFVTGVLGVLQAAAKRNLVSLTEVFDALSGTSFRHKRSQFDELLKEFSNQNSPEQDNN